MNKILSQIEEFLRKQKIQERLKELQKISSNMQASHNKRDEHQLLQPQIFKDIELSIKRLKIPRQVLRPISEDSQLPKTPQSEEENPLNKSASEWLKIMPEYPRCVILGSPGSGKSATAHMLLELHRLKMRPYILGFPERSKQLLPEWIGLARRFDKIPPNSIILVDEAYLFYQARKSGFDKNIHDMSMELGLSRQRQHSIIFIAHEARHLDKNIIGYANLFLIKKPCLTGVKFERPELRQVMEKAREFYQKVEGDKKKYCYVWSPEKDFEGPLEAPLPSY